MVQDKRVEMPSHTEFRVGKIIDARSSEQIGHDNERDHGKEC